MSANLNDAAMGGNYEEVLMRLNLGEDPNQKMFPRYSTPLHDATTCGRVDIAKLLIERGADVNALDYKGMTPLRLARRYGQDDIEAFLESKGGKDLVQKPERKPSVGVDPPWIRKTSRREEVAFGN
ncbi:unnamed protein product [Lepeophtheirus salmonis]|uniref:(salmon louse) hypothetical protein n=1 Tax=Lepeophtheirus salmonis TaxID=72036 RepID=A0A0K2UNL9_LEPSM|nr:myotrophin-like [Lepeophtheirus salmonis]CAB4067462.1 unnamed protein product [Lepeophtheirus salmonis]CAF2988270.1 unnamed protein product [Lepeophtheirus salmonis]